MAERKEVFCEDDQNFIFRFKLEPPQNLEGDPLTDLVKSQLQALLDIVLLFKGEEPVKVDGFRFLNSAKTYSIWSGE